MIFIQDPKEHDLALITLGWSVNFDGIRFAAICLPEPNTQDLGQKVSLLFAILLID